MRLTINNIFGTKIQVALSYNYRGKTSASSWSRLDSKA